MSLKIYNQLTKKLEEFKPIDDKEVKVYTCGPTLYNRAHIGNLRAYIFADTLRRTLNFFNYKTKYVINLTDVGHLTENEEDKVEAQAKKQNDSVDNIVNKYLSFFYKDLERLNIPKDKYIFPKATEYIKEQIDIIKELERKGFTYEIEDGIYFDVGKYKEYGALGQIQNSEGYERIKPNEEKKDLKDFVLWKRSNEKRQQVWDSPWGEGFPGWHIECSAMAINLLGETIDIHTGGVDHIAIHHNNEIAQSENYTGKKFSNYWMHSEFLNLNSEKMSKSLENFYSIDDLIDMDYKPLAFRFFVLQANFNSPINFNLESLAASELGLKKINKFYFNLSNIESESVGQEYNDKITSSIEDNLNTPKLISLCFEVIKSDLNDGNKKSILEKIDNLLGILDEEILKEDVNIPQQIIDLANERLNARQMKDYDTSDKIREEINKLGYKVIDTNTEDGFVIKTNTKDPIK